MPYVTYWPVARGRSGRIVLEVDPALKRELYVALTAEDATLKDWFVEQARTYLGKTPSKRPRRKQGS